MRPQAGRARVAADYRSERLPMWCAGCGDFGVLTAVYRALARLEADPDRTVVVSGIGCSSRMPAFMAPYGFHTVHGRALPVALGVKAANPELTVLCVSGDGDALAIGAGHLPHAARRNPDVTLLLVDNATYGLTKGQPSPSRTAGEVPPLDPILTALAADASFVARGTSWGTRDLVDLMVEAVRHPGFALVDALSPCVVFHDQGDVWREAVVDLPDEHDPSDRAAAFAAALAAQEAGRLPVGVFARRPRPTLEQQLAAARAAAAPATPADLVAGYRVG